ncbi:MAG: hypothetical protein KF900_02800 [Bacteroidetes bacterium]|nr:hypothetical protein [Bacteroidota bacterium]
MKKQTVLFIFLLANCLSVFAQEQEEHDPEEKPSSKKAKFLTGLYVGSYFANKYTASMYDGYGFDIDGNRNSYPNSLMYQKIKMEYGGGFGFRDQVAEALGVDPGQWNFDESDMPVNMRYTPAISVGVNFKFPVNPTSFFLLNVNGVKLNAEGVFTITKIRPQNPNPAVNPNLVNMPIRGSEQRLMFQLAFQRLFGEDEKINFLFECGLMGTLSKFDKNTIYINTLVIDLVQYNNQSYNTFLPMKRPLGFGIGAYAGAGLNIDMSEKFIAQIVYTPSFEKVNMGVSPTLKWQNSVGLRFYYKM